MNTELIKYIKKGINENNLSHAFLVESNNIEETITNIYNTFVEMEAIPNIKIENNLSVLLIADEKNTISQDKIINLQKFLIIKNQTYKYKIYFIYDALLMNATSSNKLLKTLEEPTENSIGFLITSSANEIMETIKSRCVFFYDNTSDEPKDYNEIIEKLENQDYKNYYHTLNLKKELKAFEKSELIEIFSEYQKKILEKGITIDIAKKYKIIDNILKLIKANVSIELCLDKFIIEMGK